MRNFLKSVIFILLLVVLYINLSYVFLPKANLKKFGVYQTSRYEILGEKPNTIDTIVLGDSLVYSSISPMEIYGEYGYTVFNCSESAMIMKDAYKYFKVAVDSQKPKVAIVESNILFRDPKKRPWYNEYVKTVRSSFMLTTYHNNWKRYSGFSKELTGGINVNKGFIKSTSVRPSSNYDYMKVTKKKCRIPDVNMLYLRKMIRYAEENDVKLIFVGFPSQKSWYDSKHRAMEKLAQDNNLTYLNLNLEKSLCINWNNETRDNGEHLNYYGAKKVSSYIGNYLSGLNILNNHKDNLEYADWNTAYEYYQKQ